MMVFLGFRDEKVTNDNKSHLSVSTSKIGGSPILFKEIVNRTPANTRSCPKCYNPLLLVSQIYCPVDEAYDRVLYIYCCEYQPCHRTSDGWLVVRCMVPILKEKRKPEETVAVSIDWEADESEDWGGGGDWGVSQPTTQPMHADGSILNATAEDDSTSITETMKSMVLSSLTADGRSLDEYFISVVEEETTLKSEHITTHDRALLEKYEREADHMETSDRKQAANKSAAGSEPYERSQIAHGDKVFYKFSKCLSRNPQQIIRYEYGGRPLPMTSLNEKLIADCPNCGSKRCFEIQLMPSLLQDLSIRGEEFPVDVGTVLIYTCASNCWSGEMLSELVVVQLDPDEHLLSKLGKTDFSITQEN